jgi:hypothetical protein
MINNKTTNLVIQINSNKYIHKLKINSAKITVKNRFHFMKTFKNKTNSKSNKILDKLIFKM